LNVDARARGTLARPIVTGDAKPAGLYSALVMLLERVFR
jgi:hypothetical protein